MDMVMDMGMMINNIINSVSRHQFKNSIILDLSALSYKDLKHYLLF